RGGQRRGDLGRRRAQREGGGGQPGGQFQAAPAQRAPQQLAAALQPPLDAVPGPAEQAGGLVQRLLFQAAEDQGGPVLLRQAVEFLQQHGPHLAQAQVERRVRRR